MKKNILNTRDGHHLNSKYWQEWKKNLPPVSPTLFQSLVGIILSDASMYRVSRNAYLKFEQGAHQKEFLFHLFDIYKEYCFMTKPSPRYYVSYEKQGQVKSYWFKTFSFSSFSIIWDLFYINGSKTIKKGIIMSHLTEVGLAYWIMGDGPLHREGRVLTLHTQGFSKEENITLSEELNIKFGFHTKVVVHKATSYVIKFSTKDANSLHDIILPHIIPSIEYKLPRKLYQLII